jgi:hypothetical protein
MDFRIVSLPPFRAASSGPDPAGDFSPTGILGRFDAYFTAIRPSPRDSFLPRDFLFVDDEAKALVWWWALADDMDAGGHDVVSFDGGLFLTYVNRDGDDEEEGRRYYAALDHIAASTVYELDVRPNHYPMGHVITPRALIEAQGFAQMETYIPIRLRAAA